MHVRVHASTRSVSTTILWLRHGFECECRHDWCSPTAAATACTTHVPHARGSPPSPPPLHSRGGIPPLLGVESHASAGVPIAVQQMVGRRHGGHGDAVQVLGAPTADRHSILRAPRPARETPLPVRPLPLAGGPHAVRVYPSIGRRPQLRAGAARRVSLEERFSSSSLGAACAPCGRGLPPLRPAARGCTPLCAPDQKVPCAEGLGCLWTAAGAGPRAGKVFRGRSGWETSGVCVPGTASVEAMG